MHNCILFYLHQALSCVHLSMLRWIAVIIFSCSSVSMPRLSNACLVPQSGQIGVSPSVLDIAGRSVYSCPQMGHTLTLSSFVSIKSYASFPLFFSVFLCQIQSPCNPECRLPGSKVLASQLLVPRS